MGETLTVDISGIADADGIDLDGNWFGGTFEIQWKTSCLTQHLSAGLVYDDPNHDSYSNRIGLTFEVPWQAAGSALSAAVLFFDEGGNFEARESAATAVVPGPIQSLVVVDTVEQSDVKTLDCGAYYTDQEVVLDADGTYSVRANLAADAEVSSISWKVRKTGFNYTPSSDNSAPYSLFGEDESDNLLGRRLPAGGRFSVDATAYSEGDEELQSFHAEFLVVHDTPATGAPTISGTAQVGQTLTASTTGISDADGLTNVSYSYQWLSSDGTTDTEIEGATSSTYTLQSSDNGKVIKVRVDFRDDAGTRESLTSVGTSAVVLGGL